MRRSMARTVINPSWMDYFHYILLKLYSTFLVEANWHFLGKTGLVQAVITWLKGFSKTGYVLIRQVRNLVSRASLVQCKHGPGGRFWKSLETFCVSQRQFLFNLYLKREAYTCETFCMKENSVHIKGYVNKIAQ